MATYMGQTVDILEDFEDGTLAGGIAESDTASLLTISQSTQFKDDAAACSVDCNNANVAYLTVTLDDDAFSWGVWYRSGAWGAYGGGPRIIVVRNDGAGTLWSLCDEQSASTNEKQFRDLTIDAADIVARVDLTWYWITGQYNRNATSYWKVYNTSKNVVGAEQSFTAPDTAVNDLFVGKFGTENIDTDIYFDSLIVDKGAAYPLLGWSTGAGGVIIPVIERMGLRGLTRLH